MSSKVFVFFLLVLGIWFTLPAQEDCSLAIGVTDTDTIIQIFQLKEEQITKLEEFKAALELEIKFLDEERQNLFENHPQSTPEELTALGEKHRVLEDKIKQVFLKYDLQLLALFNEKQYDRYAALCQEVSRIPLVIRPE
ncbi:hypothetical protein EHW67_12030 [Arenibacter aquaticus]|uniref:Periplasmic heavy metal sensor n=1 Tax=Arenibacter aquaticus TaxID=2489054 RepID=A0A3S0AM15_9FLAO|nr:hypothetical protein [Arenibacter aquaticus]RTE53205.1 hypothetical protein EHW67_12030 [Arenibacter aquaticus]